MECPLCGYVMDPFDTECRRCHGKGLPTAQPAAPASPPQAVVASPATGAALPPQPASGEAPPYFFAAHESALSNPKLYRIYGDEAALLVIFAGPYHMAMIDTLKRLRGDDGTVSADMAKAVGRAAGVGARTGGASGAGIGLAAGGAVAGLMWVGNKIAGGQVAKRAAVLDAMTLDDLRREAETGKDCCRIAPDTVRDVELRPVSKSFFTSDEQTLAGYLNFTHRTAGKWKLKLVTMPDAHDAVHEFRRVLGADKIKVTFPF